MKLEIVLYRPDTPTPFHLHTLSRLQELSKCPHLSKDSQSRYLPTLQSVSCKLVLILSLRTCDIREKRENCENFHKVDKNSKSGSEEGF